VVAPLMPKIRLAQTSCSLGEFSPLLAGRSDLAQYRNGAESLENRRLLSQGGTDTRPGLRHFAAVPETSGRLVPYIFSLPQRYLLRFGHTFFQPYTMDGTVLPGVQGAPWTAGQLRDLRIIQSGDTMLIFHPDWPPRRIRRFSATDFALDEMPLEYTPYYRFTDPSVTLDPSALTGPVIFTASANIFSPAMVGQTILFRGARALITGYSTPTAVNAEWQDDTTGIELGASIEWAEQAWSSTRGWPSTGAFFSGRLAIGGSRDIPNVVWLSKSGAYFNFQTGSDEGDGLAEVVAGEQSGRIVHLFAAARLLVFTDTAVWALVGSSAGPITPTNVAIRSAADIGAAGLQPAQVDGATLFLDATGSTLREVQIDEYLTGFSANPVSLLAEHLIKGPVSMTVLRGNARRPEIYAVLVNSDGELSLFHSLRQEKIAAFVPWRTAGRFKDVCAVGPDLFALVERGGVWSVERFDEAAEPLDASRIATAGNPTRTFSGFGHLAGQTVGLVSRGHDLGDATVAGNGTITLPASVPAVDLLEAGHRYRQVIRPMPADLDLQDGPARGLKKRLLRVILLTDRSGQLEIAGRKVLLQFTGDDVATQAATHTGVIRKRMLGVSLDAQMDIEVEGAQKVTVLSLTREISING
jgi:hypothetical protein